VSIGSRTHQPTKTAATIVSTAVSRAIVHSGSAHRTDQPSWSTSREVRVSRSPLPADSTTPTGSASELSTKSSRRSARISSPSTDERNRALRVNSVCTTTAPAMTAASRLTWPTVVPACTSSTIAPTSRGATSPARAAAVCRTRAMTSGRRCRRASSPT
jgi:hypothetical protein